MLCLPASATATLICGIGIDWIMIKSACAATACSTPCDSFDASPAPLKKTYLTPTCAVASLKPANTAWVNGISAFRLIQYTVLPLSPLVLKAGPGLPQETGAFC